MIKFREYKKAESLEEAYQLNLKKNNFVIGGMMWLKMMRRNLGTAIDISGLGLDLIEEEDECYKIGAQVTLRMLEKHEGFNAFTGNAMRESVRHIVGTQFRNTATVGGSIYGRYGFSDVLTLFLALGAEVEFYHRGKIDLRDFAKELKSEPDILMYIYVPKNIEAVDYRSVRNQSTDFPVLTCAVAKKNGAWTAAIGARPRRAVAIDDEGILSTVNDESVDRFIEKIQGIAVTGSNQRASAEYRSMMTQVLVKRAIKAIEGDNYGN